MRRFARWRSEVPRRHGRGDRAANAQAPHVLGCSAALLPKQEAGNHDQLTRSVAPRGYAPPVARVFRHRLRVRYGECDPQSVVFNANYLAYFDVILTEFWREAIGRYGAMLEDGADMGVAESRIRFLGPAFFDEELDFELRVERLGNTALSTLIDARVGDRPVVAGEMRHVFIDPSTKQKRTMPEDIRRGLEPYVVGDRDLAPQ